MILLLLVMFLDLRVQFVLIHDDPIIFATFGVTVWEEKMPLNEQAMTIEI